MDLLLTRKEFSLLLLFVEHKGGTMSAEYLYEKIWGREMGGDDKAIRVMVSKLRKKMTGSGASIRVERGEGYRFEAPDS